MLELLARKPGGLARSLEISSYQTAWAIASPVALGAVRPGRERLQGTVEVDGDLES